MSLTGIWRKPLQKLICGATALALVAGLLPADALAAEEPGADAAAGEHISALEYTLAEDLFTNGDNWTKSNQSITIENGKASFTGLSGTNRIDWKNGKIDADKFLIQFDLTPSIDTGLACDVSAEFMLNPSNNKRLVVRFKMSTNSIKIGSATDGTEATLNNGQYDTSGTFAWHRDQPSKIDILVNRTEGTLTVYVDGEQKAEVTNHVSDIQAMERGNFAFSGQWANQTFAISNFKITTDEKETTDPGTDPTDPPVTELKHIDPLAVEIGNTAFTGENWTLAPTNNGTVKIEDGALIIRGAGGDNRADWNGGKIQADKFLIQMDVTSQSAVNNDLKVEFFKEQEGADGLRVQVRFKFGEKLIKIGKVSASNDQNNSLNGKDEAFPGTMGNPAAIDILVDKENDTITVYVDSEQAAKSTASLAGFYQGYFGLSGQWGSQDLKIENLKITAEKTLAEEINKTALAQAVADAKAKYGDNSDGTYTADSWAKYGAALAAAEAELASAASTDETVQDALDALNAAIEGLAKSDPDADKAKHIAPLDGARTLAEDTFQNGESWTASGPVTIGDRKAGIKGSGPDNYMVWAAGTINADTFRISMDFTFNEGNTNGAAKIAFMGADASSTDRMQVRLVYTGDQHWLAIQKGDEAKKDDCAVSDNFDWTFGKTYGIDIDVTADKIILYIDAEKVLTLEKAKLDWTELGRGWFSIRSQYPNQDFTVENFSITTNEAHKGDPIPFTLADSKGGTVTVASGAEQKDGKWYAYAGDLVTLEAAAAHGYVFDRYTTNTDGLITIPANGRFTMETPKNDSELTITAVFSERQGGRFELWYDDFGYDTLNDPDHPRHNNGSWNDNRYDIKEEAASLADGTLRLGTTGSNYLQIPAEIAEQLNGKNYRITVDAWQAAGSGTMQIMFNGSGSTAGERFSNRTVVIINGNDALFKVFTNGAGDNDKLGHVSYSFNTTPATLQVEVTGDTAVLYAGGKEITRYTSPDNWGGRTPAVGLINMTAALTMGYDNLTVELMPDRVQVSVETTLDGKADESLTAGTARADTAAAVAGDVVTLTATAKAGYEFENFTAKAPYADAITFTDNKDGTWSFAVPDEASDPIVITANFVSAEPGAAREYYIDSVNGSDSNPGTQAQPWQSLEKLQKTVLNPGDTVCLKRGSVFNGQQLTFQGAGGTADKRITVTAYGEGSLPRLNGEGKLDNVVELWNTPYVTIENLEITNLDPAYGTGEFVLKSAKNNSKALRAINIYAKDYGVVSGIYIRNCYIHDVNGTLGGKWNGGIFFDIQGSSIPTKYDDIIIENNTIIDVNRSAIKLVSSSWSNQSLTNNPGAPIKWYPSTNVVVRNNYMERIGGDGITTRDVDGALVEYNLAKDCNYQANCPANPSSMYNVGIWPFQASNTVLQYNEAYNTHSILDGQGLDCDHLSSNSVMQYNYSHDNEGGFMLIMGQWEHTSVTVRYNISQNDKDKTFEFTRGVPKGTAIYNNTIYSDTVLNRGILWRPNNTGSSVGNNEVYLFNNLFIFPAGQPVYGGADNSCRTDMQNAAKLYNNAYVGGMTAPDGDSRAVSVADTASVLAGAGTGPAGYDAGDRAAHTGSSGLLGGYQLAEGSPLIDKGVTLEEALKYFNGGSAPALTDMRAMSPLEAFNTAYGSGGGPSIRYVNADPVSLPGVRYDVDFFGNSGLAGAAPDIGAAEYGAQHIHNLIKVEAAAHTCTEAGHDAYWQCKTCGGLYADEDADTKLDKVPVIPAAHTLLHVVRVPATATAAGLKEHWKCEACGKLFEDEAGTRETTLDALTIPKSDSDTGGSIGGTAGGSIGGNTGGTTTETVTSPEGVTGTTTKDRSGNVSSVEVRIPANVASGGGVVTAPVKIESAASTAQAPGIGVSVSGGGSAKVEIPVVNVSHGTVAVAVDKDGNETVLRDCVVTKDGILLTVDGSITVKIVENGKTFPDTAGVPWAEDAIAFTSARELFLGSGTGFEPNMDTSRAMMVTLLYRLEYEPDSVSVGFGDVQGGRWYTDAVSWAQNSGVVMGYGSGFFGPDDPITREQMALILYRYARSIGIDTSARADLSGYVDSGRLSGWAGDAMQWAVATGLFEGCGNGVLDPSGNATRAQAAVLLMRFCEKKALN